MVESVSISLVQSIINSQKELVVLFDGEKHLLANSAFNSFFGVASIEEYSKNFGDILGNFVPHPSYFHKEKVKSGESWFDAVLRLDELNRIVSMVTPTFEPCAFLLKIDRNVADYSIVTFSDITRDLIKRIMIENNASIDEKSGAYDKKYFLEVRENFENAAVFNEKRLGAILVSINQNENPDFVHDKEMLKKFVNDFKRQIRQDDMLVRWDSSKFLLLYLVDNETNAQQMTNKMQNLLQNSSMKDLQCEINSVIQNENEKINALLLRVQSQN